MRRLAVERRDPSGGRLGERMGRIGDASAASCALAASSQPVRRDQLAGPGDPGSGRKIAAMPAPDRGGRPSRSGVERRVEVVAAAAAASMARRAGWRGDRWTVRRSTRADSCRRDGGVVGAASYTAPVTAIGDGSRVDPASTAGIDTPRVKLVVAIVHNEDAGALVDALLEKEFRATRLHSSGGFLKQSNATIVARRRGRRASTRSWRSSATNCTSRTQVVNPMPPIMEPGEFFMPYPLEVEVGGATVFVLPGRAVRAALARPRRSVSPYRPRPRGGLDLPCPGPRRPCRDRAPAAPPFGWATARGAVAVRYRHDRTWRAGRGGRHPRAREETGIAGEAIEALYDMDLVSQFHWPDRMAS